MLAVLTRGQIIGELLKWSINNPSLSSPVTASLGGSVSGPVQGGSQLWVMIPVSSDRLGTCNRFRSEDATFSSLPSYAVWQVGDAVTAVGLCLGAQLVLIPSTFVAMLTLVRKHALGLTLAFVGLNTVLLVPLRGADAMALLLVVVVPVVLHLQLRFFGSSPSLSTPQGYFVRAVLALPVLVVVGRTVLHYPLTSPFVGSVLLTSGLALFAHMVRLTRDHDRPVLNLLQVVGVISMLLGWVAIAMSSSLRELLLPLRELPQAGMRSIDAGSSYTS